MFLKLVILILLQKKENQRHSQNITEFYVLRVGNRVGRVECWMKILANTTKINIKLMFVITILLTYHQKNNMAKIPYKHLETYSLFGKRSTNLFRSSQVRGYLSIDVIGVKSIALNLRAYKTTPSLSSQ